MFEARAHLAPFSKRAAHAKLRPKPDNQRHAYVSSSQLDAAETVRIKHACLKLMSAPKLRRATASLRSLRWIGPVACSDAKLRAAKPRA